MLAGNAKKGFYYLQTAPSKKAALRNGDIEYRKEVAAGMNEPVQFTVRNRDQAKYYNKLKACKERLGNDPFVTMHEIAFSMKDYVWHITSFPDLEVCFGSRALRQFTNTGRTVLSYDTTFLLGDFYLSAIVTRLDDFEEKPCVPLGFILHDRKYQSIHETFLRQFQLAFPNLKDVVIVTDGEKALSGAVSCVTSWSVAYCAVHIINDVDFWVKKHEGTADDRLVYKTNVRELLLCSTEEQLQSKLKAFSQSWSQSFLDYFNDQLHTRVLQLYSGYLHHLGLSQDSISTNMSESLNAVLKRLQDWKEVTHDLLLMAVYRWQLSHLAELKKSCSGFGPYKLIKDCATAVRRGVLRKLFAETIILYGLVGRQLNFLFSF